VTWLNPPSEIDPHTLQILGISTSDEILFSVQAVDKRVASALTRIAFDHSVLCAYGRRMRLEGAATIQDSMQTGILIVRSKFTVLTDF
jgi:hypothetical protein